MSLIEQLGGYEQANSKLLKMDKILKEVYYNHSDAQKANELRQALLEYRHQHNIFEVEDKVISINSAFIEYQGVLNIDFINRFDLMLSDNCKGFEVNAICGWSKIIRHATDEEIKVGHRL